jgi:long-chain acyl-CoA synthetase
MSVLAHARLFGDVLRGHAAARPHKIAFETTRGSGISFGHVNLRANRLNQACRRLKLVKGDRAAILSRNRPEYFEVFGLAKSGIIVVPLNWRLAASELAKLLAHSRPKILFVDDSNRTIVESIRSSLPFVETIVLIGGKQNSFFDYEAFLATGDESEPAEEVLPDDILCLIYTSGTTGAPKGVAVTHVGALGNCRSAADALALTDSDHTMAVMPLFHAGGMWYHLFPSFASGCSSVILSEFEPSAVLSELAARRTSNVHLVPSMIGALLACPELPTLDLSHLRVLFYAASSMPAEMLRQAMSTLPHCDFLQCYGSTEAGVVTVLDPAAHRRASTPDGEHLLRSCGKPLASCAVRITGTNGSPVAAGSVGEIEVSSPNVMAGYWADPAATRAVKNGEFLKTGDLGVRDEEGFIFIVDRKHDMMITGGENVFPTEVEDALYEDPDIQEAAVFGIPDPTWVEKVVAAVVLRSGSTASSEILIERLKAKLAGYKCPKEIYIRSNLPKSAVGKVLRKELRQKYGANG